MHTIHFNSSNRAQTPRLSPPAAWFSKVRIDVTLKVISVLRHQTKNRFKMVSQINLMLILPIIVDSGYQLVPRAHYPPPLPAPPSPLWLVRWVKVTHSSPSALLSMRTLEMSLVHVPDVIRCLIMYRTSVILYSISVLVNLDQGE